MYLNLSLEYQAKDARIIPPRHVKCPASQSPHALAPTAFAARPAAHLLHTAAPALLQLPLPQSKHHSLRDNTLDSVQPFQAWFPKSLGQICSKVEVLVTVSATKKSVTPGSLHHVDHWPSLLHSFDSESGSRALPNSLVSIDGKNHTRWVWSILKTHPIWQSNTKQKGAQHAAWFTFFTLAPTLQGEAPWNAILACLQGKTACFVEIVVPSTTSQHLLQKIVTSCSIQTQKHWFLFVVCQSFRLQRSWKKLN